MIRLRILGKIIWFQICANRPQWRALKWDVPLKVLLAQYFSATDGLLLILHVLFSIILQFGIIASLAVININAFHYLGTVCGSGQLGTVYSPQKLRAVCEAVYNKLLEVHFLSFFWADLLSLHLLYIDQMLNQA